MLYLGKVLKSRSNVTSVAGQTAQRKKKISCCRHSKFRSGHVILSEAFMSL